MSESKLRSPLEIPLKFRHIFAQYETFNKVQSKVIDSVLYSDDSVVISAPTGSGKTAIFELAILRLLMRMEELRYEGDYKIVYVAPVKALCMEKFADWKGKFESIGLKCLEATGDSEVGDFSCLMSSQLVVTTPEKWDSLTRKWKDAEGVVEAVKLFLIDEVHLVNEDVRGPILEAIVSRMKTIQHSKKLKGSSGGFGLRLIAASATIPNIDDLADWLGEGKSASFYQISETLRPVQLQRHVIGFSTPAQGFRFDMNLNYKLASVIQKYSKHKPTLIFCSSRKSVEMATKVLADNHGLISLSDMHKIELQQITRSIQDAKLKQFLIKGIAYHHAGLSYQDRAAIEDAFRKSIILILVCTNTLAMGVNFPAHLVIIKSTENYVCGKSQEYTEIAILQMIGRAGRPQYDQNGVAVIMTQQKNVKKYENLMNGCTPVESHLHKHLAEHLNSEIVLQTVTDLSVAMKWIRSTFLYVRAVKCPMNYGFAQGMPRDAVEKKLQEICISHVEALERCGLIIKDQTFCLCMASTGIGRLMARFYVSFDTMKTFRQIQGNESILETFNTIISGKEFSEFTLRVNDKKLLNAINNHPIRFPIKGKIKTNENKISCLIQAVFDNITIQDPSMMQDALRMIRLGEKLSKCFSEYIRLAENYLCGKIYKALSNSTIISKCFKAKLWNNTQYVSKQLKNIGPVYSSLFVNAGKTSIQSILETGARKIEMILGKAPPFGDQILESLSTFPKYSLELTRKSHNFLQVLVKQNNRQYIYEGHNAILIVGDADNNLLFYNCKVDQTICEEGIFEKVFSIKNDQTTYVQAKLIHESLVGVDQNEKIVLNPEDELVETKRRSAKKVQSKIKTVKAVKMDSVPVEAINENLYDCELGEHDDYFDDITEAGVYPILAKDTKLEMESCGALPTDCEASISSIKRKLKCFHSIPKLKITKIERYSAESINSTKTFGELTGIDESNIQDDVVLQDVMDNEILQELLKNEQQMENDFINSQVQKYAEEIKCPKLSCSPFTPLNLPMSENLLEAEQTETTDHLCSAATEDSGVVLSKSTSRDEVDSYPKKINQNLEQFNNTNTTCVPQKMNLDFIDGEAHFARVPQKSDDNHSGRFCYQLQENFNSAAVAPEPINQVEMTIGTSDFILASNSYSENDSRKLYCDQKHDNNAISTIPNRSISTSECQADTEVLPCSQLKKNIVSIRPPENKSYTERTPKQDVFRRPNLAMLRGYSTAQAKRQYVSCTPQPRNASFCTEYFSKLSKSCFFQKKLPASHHGLSGRITMSNDIPKSTENNGREAKKLDDEFYADEAELLATTNHNIQNFFKESESTTDKNPSLSSLSSTTTKEDLKTQVADILRFRALSERQPIFKKVLPIKIEPRSSNTSSQLRQPSHPENDRIDAILQKVGQEPIRQLSEVIHNPYRIKLSKRQKPNTTVGAPKQNFEFFENLRSRWDLEKPNSTLMDPSLRGEKNMAQMSRIMFAARKATESVVEDVRLNVASLPKPDIKVFERHAEKSNLLFREASSETNFFSLDTNARIENNIGTSESTGIDFSLNLFDTASLIHPNILAHRKSTSKDFQIHSICKNQKYGADGDRNKSINTIWKSTPFTSAKTPIKSNSGCFESIEFGCNIKNEPLSPSFEALSLLADKDIEDAAFRLNTVKNEMTEENADDIIDLTSTMGDEFFDVLPQSQNPFGDDLESDQLTTQSFVPFD